MFIFIIHPFVREASNTVNLKDPILKKKIRYILLRKSERERSTSQLPIQKYTKTTNPQIYSSWYTKYQLKYQASQEETIVYCRRHNTCAFV